MKRFGKNDIHKIFRLYNFWTTVIFRSFCDKYLHDYFTNETNFVVWVRYSVSKDDGKLSLTPDSIIDEKKKKIGWSSDVNFILCFVEII